MNKVSLTTALACLTIAITTACSTTQPQGTVTVQGRGSQVLTDKGDPLLSEGAEAKRVPKDFAAGYAKGISDHAKRGYWEQVDAQRDVTSNEGKQRYYDATIPEHEDQYGVRRVPREVVVPIVE